MKNLLYFSTLVVFISSITSQDFYAQTSSVNEVEISTLREFESGSLVQRCNYMQAQRRRLAALHSRYKSLHMRTNDLIKSTPFERRSIAEELQQQKNRIETQIAIIERDRSRMNQIIVRQGCPLIDLEVAGDERTRELFEMAEKAGVFVDDHIIRVENYEDYEFVLEFMDSF